MQAPLPPIQRASSTRYPLFPEFIIQARKILGELVETLTSSKQSSRYYEVNTADKNAYTYVDLLNFVVTRSMDANAASTLRWELLFTDAQTTVAKEQGRLVTKKSKGQTSDSSVRMWVLLRMASAQNKRLVINILQHANEQLAPFVLCFALAVQNKDLKVIKSPVGTKYEFIYGTFCGDLVKHYLRLGNELVHHVQVKAAEKDQVTITIAKATFANLFAKIGSATFAAFLDDFIAFMEQFKQLARNRQSYTLEYSLGGPNGESRQCYIYEIQSPDSDYGQVRKEALLLAKIKKMQLAPSSKGERIITFCTNREIAQWNGANVSVLPYRSHMEDDPLGTALQTHLDPAKNRATLFEEMDDTMVNIAYLKSMFNSNIDRNWQIEHNGDQCLYKYVGVTNIIPFMDTLINVLKQNSSKFGAIVSGIIISPSKDSLHLTGAAVNFFFDTPNPVLKPAKIAVTTPIEVFKIRIKLNFLNCVFAICEKYRTDETTKIVDKIEKSVDVALPKNGLVLYLKDSESELNKSVEKYTNLRNELQMALWKYSLCKLVPNYLSKAKQENMTGFEALLNKLQTLLEKESFAELPGYIEELEAVIKRQETPAALGLMQKFRSSLISCHQKVQEAQAFMDKTESNLHRP